MKIRMLPSLLSLAGLVVLPLASVPARGQAKPKSVIVEEIIARVNNSIITLSDFQKADNQQTS